MIEHRVKVADYAVARGPGNLIVTIGLGSCVAIALYDAAARVGGLAHVLLPHEGLSRDSSNRAKFPASAVPLLVEEMRRLGAGAQLTAKLVGGASMFGALITAGSLNIGERNVEASRQALEAARIPVAAEDLGGDYGRSVYFDLGDGRVRVRSIRHGERAL